MKNRFFIRRRVLLYREQLPESIEGEGQSVSGVAAIAPFDNIKIKLFLLVKVSTFTEPFTPGVLLKQVMIKCNLQIPVSE